MRFFLSILFVAVLFNVQGKNGTIKGAIIEDATGETLIGATIQIAGTTIGTITDLDGKFALNIAVGTYDVKISYISFQDIMIKNVHVKANEVTVLEQLRMRDADLKLNEIVVTAEAIRTTEVALMSIRKNAQTMMDGISSSKMSLIGDASAVEAVKRVIGVSIEGGKYVYVRGLGDRYSKTMMNNAEIPGLDPDRNTIQMDIFPTNLISNMTISKTFTVDLPADFTGGLINIETVGFPERKTIKASVGTSYNPNMNLRSDFISYKGGDLDFLGFDDDTRALPDQARGERIPTPLNDPSGSTVNEFLKGFNPTMAVREKMSLLNMSLSFSMGNQLDIERDGKSRKLGYVFSFSYKNDYEYSDNVFLGDYQKDIDNSVYDLIYADKKTGQLSEQNTLMGMLGGIAYKSTLSKLRFTIMHLQKGTSTASHIFKDNNSEAVGQSGYTAITDVLTYNQSSLTNVLITGKHVMQNQGWSVDWRISPTYSYSADPDIRETPFSIIGDNQYTFNAGEGGLPSRTWRYLKELNTVAKVDFTKKYSLIGDDAKLKFGGSYTIKYRDYEILGYNLKFFGTQPNWSEPNPDLILQGNNLFPNGRVYLDNAQKTINPNEYQSNNHTMALYVSNDFVITRNLKSVLGLRVENFVQRHTGRDAPFANGNSEGHNLDNEKVLKSFDFFPSVNFIYTVAEEQNIRIAYSNTIARPSFKEVSYAQIIDPITNIIFNGALYDGYSDWDGNIQETRINNFDIRYEFFLEKGQIVSISGFAKIFDKPIEIVRIPEQQTSIEVQPRNVGNGKLFGFEFEFVKSLGFITPVFNELSVNGNFTYVYSEVKMTDGEYDFRVQQARIGETVKNRRPMAGQAPWVVNGGFTYLNKDMGLDVGVFYNVKGPTLKIVGLGISPDIYTVPFQSLNFSANKTFGRNSQMSVGFKVSNILNDRKEEVFESYKAVGAYALIKEQGRTFSLGFTYKF